MSVDAKTTLEVLLAPAEFAALARRDLSRTMCVVFDVLRATSTIVTALANGAEAVRPVEEIADALEERKKNPHILLAGERGGRRIGADLSGGVEFDLGNSPREFTRERVAGRRIVMTTTNGTRALSACAGAQSVLATTFLNLSATVVRVQEQQHLLLVCSGTGDQAAYEDVLCAGALCDRLWPLYERGEVSDSALMARRLFRLERDDLTSAVARSRNGRRLLAAPDLRDDVAFCLQTDLFDLVTEQSSFGWIERSTQ